MTVNSKIGKPKRILTNTDRDRLSELLRKRLIECGWKDQVRMLYHQVVNECEGENITFDMIVSKMTPRAHALVPDAVKDEFIQKIIACRGPRILRYIRERNAALNQIRVREEIHHVLDIDQEMPELAAAAALRRERDDEDADPGVPALVEVLPQLDQ